MRRASAWIVLPTTLTLGNALCGFMAMHRLTTDASAGGREAAAWLLLAGWLFDLFDGPAARWAQATGPFGQQMDSLTDVLTFGAAPALLMAASGPPLAWGAAGVLLCAAILRLARFGVDADETPHLWFAGLPSAGSAALIASMVLWGAHAPGTIPPWTWPSISIALALLMVSRIPYPDLPKHVARGNVPRWTLLPLAALFAWQPRAVLLAGWFLYAVTPPLAALFARRRS